MAQRRDHQVAGPVRVHVQHRERVLVAREHERLGVGVARQPFRTRTRRVVGSALRGDARRCRSLRQPAQSRSRLDALATTRRSSDVGARARLDERRRRVDAALGRVAPRAVHADGAVLDVVVADDEHVRHLLDLGPADARAERVGVRVDQLGPEALGLQAVDDLGARTSSWRSATGSTVTCTGASHAGNAPA